MVDTSQINRIIVPLDFISAKRVQVGDTIAVNINLNGFRRAVQRVYRVMTVDRVNEIASCELLRELRYWRD